MSHRIAAPLPTPGRYVVSGVVRQLRRWSEASQQGARRNAMVACTAAAARRAEREEVADFLTSLGHQRHPTTRAHG